MLISIKHNIRIQLDTNYVEVSNNSKVFVAQEQAPNTENRDFDSNNVEKFLLLFSSITIINFNSSQKYCYKLKNKRL